MTLDEAINDALARIHAAAKRGDQVRLRAILRELLEPRFADAAETHRARLAALAGDGVALAGYLGEIGVPEAGLRSRLGHRPTAAEARAHAAGRQRRIDEMRAVQLERARRGQDIPPWAVR
jgi:hypothetical protein